MITLVSLFFAATSSTTATASTAAMHERVAPPALAVRSTLGEPGQLVFGGAFALSRELETSTTFAASPEVAYFVARDLAVTAGLELAYVGTDQFEGRALHLGGSIGGRWCFAIVPEAGLSFFPGASLGLAHESYEDSSFSRANTGVPLEAGSSDPIVLFTYDRTLWSARFDLPLVYAPVPHLFFGFGPRLTWVFAQSGGDRYTVLSGALTVGGWL